MRTSDLSSDHVEVYCDMYLSVMGNNPTKHIENISWCLILISLAERQRKGEREGEV